MSTTSVSMVIEELVAGQDGKPLFVPVKVVRGYPSCRAAKKDLHLSHGQRIRTHQNAPAAIHSAELKLLGGIYKRI